ncbi:hypothetical protein [Streptomyces caniscabiei]|uniref:hypothetical protein n=1 Tax=Streptomyces caniscabiei TaxID=2746961 RepID=UPI000765BEE1|nr:hypothetical protein [Streptomyces caniscabiei]
MSTQSSPIAPDTGDTPDTQDTSDTEGTPDTPSSSWPDKLSAVAATLGVLLSAASSTAERFTRTPEWFGVAAIVALGGALSLAAWRWLSPTRRPAAHATPLHRLFVGLLVAATVIGAVMAWPTPAPTAQADPKSAADPTKGIDVTKVGSQVPTEETMEVAHCLTVSGVGKMPKGYWLWVANNRDVDGQPEAGSYNNMQRASQPAGETRWATTVFGVGERADTERIIWIHVFLLPRSTDTQLKAVHGGAWGISGTYAGTEPIATYKVRQDGTGDC